MWPTLKRSWQFDLVYNRGSKRTAPAVVLFLLEQAPHVGVGYVASRKVGGAVRRNRAKRLLRTAFHSLTASGDVTRGWLVLVARPPILAHGSDEVADQLRSLLGAGGGEPQRQGAGRRP